MRLNGVEPSRPVRDTRPSTLRVYQFRHSRSRGVDSRCLPRLGGGAWQEGLRRRFPVACVRTARYSANKCSNVCSCLLMRRITWWTWT